MKPFECGQCGQLVHYDNVACVACGSRLGFLPNKFAMLAISQEGGVWRAAGDGESQYRLCGNTQYEVCNWLLAAPSSEVLCLACRHNHIIPDLSSQEHIGRWSKLEIAKRHLFYSLLRWNLTNPDPAKSLSSGLSFDFLSEPPDGGEKVLTGHAGGVITINLAEADDAERELRRTEMNETYRTLLGHFRHEAGHYYWDRLVRDGKRMNAFRAVFGDERADYQGALKAHYENGPPPDWANNFITAYASTHPWEDFAETWAHYIHIVDALETAHYFGLKVQPRIDPALDTAIAYNPYLAGRLDDLIPAWVSVTLAINSINRSMGQPDLYPFVLSKTAVEKLSYVHSLIRTVCAV